MPMIETGQRWNSHGAQRASSSSPRWRTPSVTSEISLAAVATAASCARAFVASTVDAWGLGRLYDDAELVASELVTNAVHATGVADPSPRWSDLDHLALIRVRLAVLADSLIVEVWDQEPTPPTLNRAASPHAENGRGLLIVKALSKRWDCYAPAEGGKWVWADLAIPPAEPEPLPKRERPREMPPVRQRQASSDPAVLRRVRDGLREL
jgi:anti-sigma regulatory factor (Ser/Thr protein kinase)